MKTIRILHMAGLVLASIILSSGIALAGGGVCTDSTYISSPGWISQGYESSLVNTQEVVKRILNENQIRIVDENNLIAGGLTRIKGESQDTTYWVNLQTIADRFTKVSVRSGPKNIAVAKKIQCDIEAKL